jgi:plastocyanin
MDGDFFFVIGIVLVLAAVSISFVGIRGSEKFPPNRGVLVGVTALFAAVVATTMAFAVVKSVDEQDKRNKEQAQEEAQAQPENTGEATPPSPGGQPQASGGGNQQAPQGAGAPSETINVSSPADAGLTYQPDGLTAKPGNLTIDYDNQQPIPHSIAVATANGNVLGQTTPAANGTQTLDISDLAPGKYIFYCTVPGHREAGMEGNLTVTGGPTP